ncbi:MAG TPA: undecaprenyl-diphosphatase UppP [Candidatus Omnitrophota bacterium]|nr:undecaprenyl-diphosphatase UppP [Candidatus Omnitrophota bacterium]
MNVIHALIYGIVEGITEFLPVSSTGHLILTARLLHASQTEFLKTFEVVIQLGAILSVVALYGKTLLKSREVWKRILVAFVPTACIGALLYKVIKRVFLASDDIVLWSLLIGGIILIVFELLHREKPRAAEALTAISFKQAVIIGLFQSLAVIPGVSRAAATIVGGLCVGLKRKTIVEFSFLLAIPTMLAAAVLDLTKTAGTFTVEQAGFLATGFVVSFVVAIAAIRGLTAFIKKHNFIPFGIYRIAVALVFWWLVK